MPKIVLNCVTSLMDDPLINRRVKKEKRGIDDAVVTHTSQLFDLHILTLRADVKLTIHSDVQPGVNFNNNLQAAFLYERL